jgi:hypothetical protein
LLAGVAVEPSIPTNKSDPLLSAVIPDEPVTTNNSPARLVAPLIDSNEPRLCLIICAIFLFFPFFSYFVTTKTFISGHLPF